MLAIAATAASSTSFCRVDFGSRSAESGWVFTWFIPCFNTTSFHHVYIHLTSKPRTLWAKLNKKILKILKVFFFSAALFRQRFLRSTFRCSFLLSSRRRAAFISGKSNLKRLGHEKKSAETSQEWIKLARFAWNWKKNKFKRLNCFFHLTSHYRLSLEGSWKLFLCIAARVEWNAKLFPSLQMALISLQSLQRLWREKA